MDAMNERTAALFGTAAMEKLKNAKVIVFGLGGVGSYAAEALARCGIGKLVLIDSDIYSETNLNRQLFATVDTIGKKKVIAAKERLLSIDPELEITSLDIFWEKGKGDESIFDDVSYCIDAIDTVSAKLDIISICDKKNIPVISCMGTGNKLDPTMFRVSDIYDTKECPLARVIRSECRKLGIKKLKVVYSEEKAQSIVADSQNGRHAPASVSFVPGVAGMIMSGEVIKDLIKDVYIGS